MKFFKKRWKAIVCTLLLITGEVLLQYYVGSPELVETITLLNTIVGIGLALSEASYVNMRR